MKAKRRVRHFKPRPPRAVPQLNERLIKVIDSLGSTSAAALAIGRSEGALRKWRRGKSEPGASDLRRLCEATGYGAEWVLFGTDLPVAVSARTARSQLGCNPLNQALKRHPSGPRRLEKPGASGDGLMQQQRATEILLGLIHGIDPLTYEELPKGSIVENAEIVRALFVAVSAIEQSLARTSRRKQVPRNVGKTWTPEENSRLVEAFRSGTPFPNIAERHGRTVRAIEARLEKLGLISAEQRTTVDRFGPSIKSGAGGE